MVEAMNSCRGWLELERAILDFDDTHRGNAIRPLFIAFKVVFHDHVDDWTRWLGSAGEGAMENTVNRAIELMRVALRPEFSERLNSLPASDKAVLVNFVANVQKQPGQQ